MDGTKGEPATLPHARHTRAVDRGDEAGGERDGGRGGEHDGNDEGEATNTTATTTTRRAEQPTREYGTNNHVPSKN